MLRLYTWTTPNGRKPAILLAELGWTCELHRINLAKHEQKSPSFLAVNPNGKIPALVDDDVVVFESGAILQYLADKAGRFLPTEPIARAAVMSWCWWQVGGPGPFFGQVGAFSREEPVDEPALQKMRNEARRLTGVLDLHLTARDYVAADYSIADMMLYPWFAALGEKHADLLDGADRVRRWMGLVGARPGVKKGMDLDVSNDGPPRSVTRAA